MPQIFPCIERIKSAQFNIANSASSFGKSRSVTHNVVHRFTDIRNHHHQREFIGWRIHDHSHLHLHCHIGWCCHKPIENRCVANAASPDKIALHLVKHKLIANHPSAGFSQHKFGRCQTSRTHHLVVRHHLLRRFTTRLHFCHFRL